MSLNLNGINNRGYAGYELTDQILLNLKFFLDNAFVAKGAYNIYTLGQDSFYANDESILRPTVDSRLPDRAVYDGVGREWVWESGISVPSGAIQPFRVSGIYVNDIFIPSSDTGPHRHHVDYRNGRIIFDESQDVNDVVSANYTSRGVYVGFADGAEFQMLMLDTVKEFLTDLIPSGTASKEHQIWLPSVFIELESGEGRGLALGGGQIKTRLITFHIFAETANDRNLLMDWLDYNNRKVFYMADLNEITFPFDQYGDIVPGTTNWTDLMNAYPWKKLRVIEGKCKTINSLNTKLYRGKVTWKIEIEFGSI